MSTVNPTQAPAAPAAASDVDVTAAIARFVVKHGPCTFAQIGEVFLPAAADGCNASHVKTLHQRLTYLTATGAIVRTGGTTRVPRWHAPSHAL